jgi:hypothetical protein
MVPLSKADTGEHSVYLLTNAKISRNGAPPRGGLNFEGVCSTILIFQLEGGESRENEKCGDNRGSQYIASVIMSLIGNLRVLELL